MATLKTQNKFPIMETLFEHLPQPNKDISPLVDYIGYAEYGVSPEEPRWHIIRVTRTAAVSTGTYIEVVEFAGGARLFGFSWEDRTELEYTR